MPARILVCPALSFFLPFEFLIAQLDHAIRPYIPPTGKTGAGQEALRVSRAIGGGLTGGRFHLAHILVKMAGAGVLVADATPQQPASRGRPKGGETTQSG